MNAGRIVIIMSLAILSCANGEMKPADMERKLIGSYREAATWQGKRDACLELIDASIVRRGTSTASLQAVFGGDLFLASGELGAEAVLFVHFQKQPDSKSPSVAVPFVGWYLLLKTDAHGAVESYSLSNLHK